MADGRCITSVESNRQLNDLIMQQGKIAYQDNYAYRMFLQTNGPDALTLPLANGACGVVKELKVLAENQ